MRSGSGVGENVRLPARGEMCVRLRRKLIMLEVGVIAKHCIDLILYEGCRSDEWCGGGCGFW